MILAGPHQHLTVVTVLPAMLPVVIGAAAPPPTFVELVKETVTLIQTAVEVWYVEWITVKPLILPGLIRHLTAAWHQVNNFSKLEHSKLIK